MFRLFLVVFGVLLFSICSHRILYFVFGVTEVFFFWLCVRQTHFACVDSNARIIISNNNFVAKIDTTKWVRKEMYPFFFCQFIGFLSCIIHLVSVSIHFRCVQLDIKWTFPPLFPIAFDIFLLFQFHSVLEPKIHRRNIIFCSLFFYGKTVCVYT